MTFHLPEEVKPLLNELELEHVPGSDMPAHAYRSGAFFVALYVRPVLDHQWELTGRKEIQLVLGEPGVETDKRNIPMMDTLEEIKDVLRNWKYPVDAILRTKRLRALIT